jgi:hypothetical protein
MSVSNPEQNILEPIKRSHTDLDFSDQLLFVKNTRRLQSGSNKSKIVEERAPTVGQIYEADA